jgi:hypothetical protein
MRFTILPIPPFVMGDTWEGDNNDIDRDDEFIADLELKLEAGLEVDFAKSTAPLDITSISTTSFYTHSFNFASDNGNGNDEDGIKDVDHLPKCVCGKCISDKDGDEGTQNCVRWQSGKDRQGVF